MTIQKILKSDLCNNGGCPAAIIADTDTVIVQGYVPSDEERDQLSAPTGESFVKMPRVMFEEIARKVLGS